MNKNSRVKVVVRTKPTASFAHEYMKIQSDQKTIVLHDEKATDNSFINNKVHDWTFNVDKILHNASQEAVYEECSKDIVIKSLNGYNSTIFAYGQTGAGKTFTITGTSENYQNRGIIPRAMAQIFQFVKEHTDTAYNISASYLEIYNETMFDLLSTLPEQKLYQHEQLQPMSVVEDSNGATSVKGLRVQCITSEEEALNLLFEGETNRVIAAHALNKSSSRSHCIFTVYIESRSRVDSMAKVLSSKLHFVDLAGSERLGKTGSSGDTQKEAVYINKSLTFLEQVIVALADKKREHIPYRQSKLTHVLKDSIGGRCNTLMIANIWGEASQIEETSSTLRFAARVMCVPSEPALNIHYDAAQLILQYEKEIKDLKLELAMHSTLANRGKINYDPISELRMQEIRREVRAFVLGNIDNIQIESVRQVKAVFQEFKNQIHAMKNENNSRSTGKLVGSALDLPTIRPKSNTISIVDDHREVGDNEGQGFGVGIVAHDGKLSPAGRKGKFRRVRDRIGSPPKTGSSDTSSVTSMNLMDPNIHRTGSAGHAELREAPEHTPHPLTYHPQHPQHNDQQQQPEHQGSSHTHNHHLHHPHQHTSELHSPSIHHHSYGHQHINPSHPNLPPLTPTQDPYPARDEVNIHMGEQAVVPSTPPTKQEAFEIFKADKGAEIYKILNDNKDLLKQKRKSIKELTSSINSSKRHIDQVRKVLDEKRSQISDDGMLLTESGEPIIDEEEFAYLKELKDSKARYRKDYNELRDKKAEIDYCQKILDQCRQRLVHDFDEWYSETYLSPDEHINSMATPDRPNANVTMAIAVEDDQEKFERLKLDLLQQEHTDSAAFYSARIRTEHRYFYGKAGELQRKKGGLVTSNIRNKPNSVLPVH